MNKLKLNDCNLEFVCEGECLSIPLDDIEYAESFDKTIEIHTVNNRKYTVKMKFKDFIAIVENKGFIHIHKSYVLNSRCIGRIRNYTVTTNTGKLLPIGQRRWKTVKEKYLSFTYTA